MTALENITTVLLHRAVELRQHWCESSPFFFLAEPELLNSGCSSVLRTHSDNRLVNGTDCITKAMECGCTIDSMSAFSASVR